MRVIARRDEEEVRNHQQLAVRSITQPLSSTETSVGENYSRATTRG